MCHMKFDGRKKKYCSKECSDEVRRRKNRERWRNNNEPKPDVTIKCEWCGKEHTVPARTAHQARFCSDDCRYTWHSREDGYRPIEERLEEWEELREQKRQQAIEGWSIQDWEYIGGYTKGNVNIQMMCLHCNRVATVEIDNIVGRKTYECTPACIDEVKQKEEKRRLAEAERDREERWDALPVKECTVCNGEFKSWQPSQVTCSDKCRRYYKNQVRKAYSKNSKYKTIVVDKGITVEKLFERDKGVCHICQQQCSFEDYTTIDGAFVVGKHYPSVDHVIPRSKGGVHSWDNIKLAHHYCNSIKNDCQDKKEVIKRLRLKRSALEGV